MGYHTLRAYLRAVPRDDIEKRAAVDLTSSGLVLCVLGALFAPLIIIGLVPLYYGVRKVAMIGMGLAPETPGEGGGGPTEQGR